MGVCVETLKVACERELHELADTIEGEMKAIVGGHSRSGKALGAIHTEMGNMSAFVGGTGGGEGVLHLYYLDEGNGSGRIYPKRHKALYLKDYGIWRCSVSTYAGIHFVHEIASRHGG